MPVISSMQVKPKVFDRGAARGVKGRVLIGKQMGASNFCMRFFQLDPGGHTPFHAHPWEHEIFIHEGRGKVFVDGQWIHVEKGDAVFIPADEDHQIKNDSSNSLDFICLIPKGPPEL